MRHVLHILPHPGGGGERYVDLLEGTEDYTHQRMFLSAGRSPLIALPSMARRWRSLRRAVAGSDIVHLHGDTASMLALPLVRGRLAVISMHGLSMLRRAPQPVLAVAHARWRRVAETVQRIVCSSQTELEEVARFSPDQTRDRLTVVTNGIPPIAAPGDDQRSSARGALGLAEGEVCCLFLGLLDRYKDPLTVVRAAEKARRQGLPVTLLVAGEGPLLGEVRKHEGAAVRALGFRRDTDRLLAAADVFVMPSQREARGPFALLEAMSYGLGIVASDARGVAEAVGSAGLIAPVGDTEAFADALRRLATDPALRSRLGAAARARVMRCFSLERFLQGMTDVYDDALASGQGA
jgi:glycosyltransferase involved in cell wall biosynthesis